MKYIQLALVVHEEDAFHRNYLFQAPLSAMLNVGDLVMVDTKHGQKEATVKAVTDVAVGSKEYDFILLATGAKEPLKPVIAKAMWIDIPREEGADA